MFFFVGDAQIMRLSFLVVDDGVFVGSYAVVYDSWERVGNAEYFCVGVAVEWVSGEDVQEGFQYLEKCLRNQVCINQLIDAFLGIFSLIRRIHHEILYKLYEDLIHILFFSQFSYEISQVVLCLVGLKCVVPLLELRSSRKRDTFFVAEELQESTAQRVHIRPHPAGCGLDGVRDSAFVA